MSTPRGAGQENTAPQRSGAAAVDFSAVWRSFAGIPALSRSRSSNEARLHANAASLAEQEPAYAPISVPSPKFATFSGRGHPFSTPTRVPRWGPRVWRRCSALKYSRYSRASRLASRAPRSGKSVTEFRTRATGSKLDRDSHYFRVDGVRRAGRRRPVGRRHRPCGRRRVGPCRLRRSVDDWLP